jgi:hypothetical protein
VGHHHLPIFSDDDLIVPFGESDESIRCRKKNRRKFFGEHISLCLGAGARGDVLPWITHARPKGTSINEYVTLIWNPLCKEVAKLKVQRRRRPSRWSSWPTLRSSWPRSSRCDTASDTEFFGSRNPLRFRDDR